jgi:hypothetical protein
MYSKLVKLGSLFVAGALAVSGSAAHADNINSSGVLCQNFNASEALDIDYLTTSVRDINASARSVICSIPRSPLATGATPEFFVDGSNSANTSTTCTVTTYSFLGTVTQSLTFTEAGGTAGRTWDHFVTFPVNGVGTFDYASVLCTIPGSGQGLIFGSTSVQ